MENNSFFQEKESKVGPVIGSLIVVIVLIIGALFFLSQKIDDRKQEINQEEQVQQESINELDKLEQELKDVEIDNTDTDLEEIEKEFDSI